MISGCAINEYFLKSVTQKVVEFVVTEADMTMKFRLPDCHLEKHVVIVGAGIAGLFCAKELQKHGFNNITILEASSQIGGRIKTLIVEGNDDDECCLVELGAERIDRSLNLIYDYATTAEQVNENAPDFSRALNNLETVYGPDEERIVWDLVTYFSQLNYLPKDSGDILNSEEFRRRFEYYDVAYLQFYAKGVYNWHCGLLYECSFLAAELKNGYHALLRSLLEDIPKTRILGDKEVVKITWTKLTSEKAVRNPEKAKIKLRCWQDSDYYLADHVVITIPLGYLKKNVDSLFKPQLSEDKVNAIMSLDFITVDKIYLEFDAPFWKIPDVFHVIWNSKLEELFGDEHDGSQGQQNWVRSISHFEYVLNYPNLLLAWIWNEGAEIMEELPTTTVAGSCMKLLEYLLKKRLPRPKHLLRSKWSNNNLYCGSLPYDHSRDVGDDISKIAETVYGGVSGSQPVLLFAGDATNKVDLACVHGAAATGVRAAHEIHSYYHDMLVAELDGK